MPDQSTYECLIIGGGPAGLTCAIFLGRYRRRVLLIDDARPRNYASHGVHGFLGQNNIKPSLLLQRGKAEATAAGVETCDCTATEIARLGDVFEVKTTTGIFRSRRVVLAYGVRDELPTIPEIEKYYGGSVHHCPDCDGFESTGKKIAVIGSGKAAAGLALKLLQWSDDVTIFTNGHDRDWTEEQVSKLLMHGIGAKDEKIIAIDGRRQQVKALVLSTGERAPVESIFFTIGVKRSCGLAEALGCKVFDDTPNIVVDEYKQTSVEGVYAIGDLAPGSQLAITSAADGAIAAIAINKSLLPPSRIV